MESLKPVKAEFPCEVQGAGLHLRSNTLRAMYAQPQGCIYDWDGDLTYEVLPTCPLNIESDQNLAAMGLADQAVFDWLIVREWFVQRVGNLIVLKPKTRDERGNLLPFDAMPWGTELDGSIEILRRREVRR